MSNAIANQLYLAYLGRPGDTAWRSSTTAVIGSATAPSVALQNAFYSAAVLDGTFSLSDSSSTLVNKIFLNIFGFSASTFEQNAWATLINNGTITAQTAAWTIFSSYLGATNVPSSYQQPAQSKLIVIDAYTNQLANDSAANIAVSQIGSSAASSARQFISTITSQATAATGVTGIASTVASVSTSTTGSTFTLTTNIDNLTGTSGNDVFQGASTSLTSLDTVNGGAGTDTLSLTSAADFTVSSVNVTSIETLSVNATATTQVTLTSASTGLTAVTNNASSAALTFGTGAGSNLTVAGTVNVSNTAQNTTVAYEESAVTGTADAVALVLTNATGASTIALNSTTANTVGLETVNITSNGTTANSIVLTTNDTAGLATINVSGSNALTLNVGTNVTTTATTISAAAATGAVTVTNLGAAAHKITGGSGNDVFQFGANLGTTDTVDGGAGTDTLSANTASFAGFTATSKPTVSNVETIALADDFGTTASVIDASVLGTTATVQNVRVADQGATGAAALTVNGLVAATSGSNNFRFDGDLGANGGTHTFNITNATTAGTANAATLDFRGGTYTATSTVAIAGVETVTVDTTNATGAVTFNLTDPALTTLTITGGQNVTLSGATLGTVVQTVNASAVTGTAAISVSLNSSAVNGATVTTAGGADTVVGSSLADTISTGGGADTITGGSGIDTITGGAGSDTINVGTAAADRDVVTDFTAGATNGDIIRFTDSKANNTAHGAGAAVAGDYRTFSASGNITLAAADFIVAITVETVSSLSTDGASVLNALVTGSSNSGTITAQNAADIVYFLVSDGTNVGVYRGFASGATADTAITANEISLIATLNSTSLSALTAANNFSFAA